MDIFTIEETMVHNSWHTIIEKAYHALAPEYRKFLKDDLHYFPDKYNFLNAFKTLPKQEMHYILFGHEPYPLKESAGGYAFIDMKVKKIFDEKGLSKEVNHATSLKNFIKMALIAKGSLHPLHTTQEAIRRIPKEGLIETIEELRGNFEKNGVLLLNRALIFTQKEASKQHIEAWQPFIVSLLQALVNEKITLILLGNHAKALGKLLPLDRFKQIVLEHPHNASFISNQDVLKLFRPMDLLAK
jgi:uracil-DNA glycosylase